MHRPKGAFRLYSSDPAEIICTDTELLYDSKRRGEPIQRIPLTDVVSVEIEDGEAAQARRASSRSASSRSLRRRGAAAISGS